MPPVIHKDKCTGCQTCVTICPEDAFGLQEDGVQVPQVQYPRCCKHCNACVLECPAQAITLRFPVPKMMVFYDAPPIKEGRASMFRAADGGRIP